MQGEKYLFVVSGPSGTGKDTIVARLLADHPEIRHTISATTRAPREGEQDGVNYYFVSKEDFERKIADGEILEYTRYCGNYYGTPKSEVDRRIAAHTTVILVIEVVGATNIKRLYPGATTVFVLPPDIQELERRLRARGTEDEATIQKRLTRAQTEIANAIHYDEHLVNVEVGPCAESLYTIIQYHIQYGRE